jgi:hypothetical protein
MMDDIKFGVAYNTFDGIELLHDAITYVKEYYHKYSE